MSDCNLHNQNSVGCAVYEGVPSGMIFKNVPFSYTPAELIDLDFLKGELIAETNRLFVVVDKNDYTLGQQRDAQTGNTASGRVLEYGLLPYAFSLMQRKPSSYNIREAFIEGAGSQKVYGIPFSSKGVFNPNLRDGKLHAKEYVLSKSLLEAADYTAGEKMLKYSFSEEAPETNVKLYETVNPDFDPNNLPNVNTVAVVIDSASATEIVCSVNLTGNATNLISTLLTANFKKLDGSGVIEPVTSVFDVNTGKYTLTGVGMTSGTLQVIPVVADEIYYNSEKTTVTVV